MEWLDKIEIMLSQIALTFTFTLTFILAGDTNINVNEPANHENKKLLKTSTLFNISIYRQENKLILLTTLLQTFRTNAFLMHYRFRHLSKELNLLKE